MFRSHNRIESIFLVSEFFYLSAILCCGLYFVYSQDDSMVAEYIRNAQSELVGDVENQGESSLRSQMDECEEISPQPETSTGNPSLSMGLPQGVNQALRKVVVSALSGVETLRLSRYRPNETEPEVAPLLVK